MPRKLDLWTDIWYDRWSVKDLRKCVEDRSGKKQPKFDKLVFVKMAVDLDAQWTFRFLDLPPEIRNAIYNQLLRLRDSRVRADLVVCSPAILAVCRTTRDEAQGLVYSENIFDVIVRSVASSEHEAAVNRTTVEFAKLDIDQVQLCDAPQAEIDKLWPKIIREADEVKLVVKLYQADDKDAEAPPPSFEQVNHILHSFATSHKGARKLQRLQVVVKGDTANIADSLLESIFYPLTQIKGFSTKDLTISLLIDGLPPAVATELQRLLTSGEGREHGKLSNTLRLERRNAMEAYIRATDAERNSRPMERLAKLIRQAGKALEPNDVYLDAAFYTNCGQILAGLRACLDGLPVRANEAAMAKR
ncbi:hypothetical protein LTR10_007165 [Elasticomyces elasticus]|nr:hypothetical protein LTR10_007165 [Elasticomyces elasticus]KAK4978982.1 hypothetical protein LTR42_001482 [Elasticomyces elasticus]